MTLPRIVLGRLTPGADRNLADTLRGERTGGILLIGAALLGLLLANGPTRDWFADISHAHLALGPIVEKGTPEQRQKYMSACLPPPPGEDRKVWRGSFALTEPLPYVGVDTGMLSGRLSVAEWKEGEEPVLRVEKRGRFITNMAVANFITAAVDSADPRIKGSCMVVLVA